MAKTLVFLEHHEDAIQKGSLGVLTKAAALGGEVAGALIGSGVRALGAGAGEFGATTVWVADDERLAAPLPQPRVDVLAKLVRDEGYDTVLFAQSVLAADIAAALAVRLDAGLNWDLIDLSADGVGKRPALQDSVFADVGWKSGPRLALFRSGSFDPKETGGEAQVEDAGVELQEFSTAATMVEQAHAESSGPSIEDADVIVAGGRGLGGPENFKLCEELAAAMGGAAEVFAQAGERDGALALLARLLSIPAGREASVALLRVDPAWDPIRGDARFGRLLERFTPR